LAAGESASYKAVELTLKTYNDLGNQDMKIEERLRSAIASANRDSVGIGPNKTTSSEAWGTTPWSRHAYSENKLVLGNVAIARAYFLRDGDCVQITEDHSYVAEQVRRGGTIISDEVSQRLRQFITRAVRSVSECRA